MIINFGLYALLLAVIPFAVLCSIVAIFYRQRQLQRAATTLLLLIVMLSPPLWARFIPQTAWQQELFVPCSSSYALDGNVLLLNEGIHRYILRFQKGEWVREATFARKGKDTGDSIEIVDPGNYDVSINGSSINSCRNIREQQEAAGFGGLGGAIAVQDNAVFFEGRTLREDSTLNILIYSSVYDGQRWSEPTSLPPFEKIGYGGSALAVDGNVLVYGQEKIISVYERDSVSEPWTLRQSLSPSGQAMSSMGFGHKVDVSGDTIVVGSTSSGVTVFKKDPNTHRWELETALTINNGGLTQFGHGVGIEGDTMVVGASRRNWPDGMVFIYQRNKKTGRWEKSSSFKPVGGRSWLELSRYIKPYGFGGSVDIDGHTIVVSTGGSRGNEGGEAFVFVKLPFSGKWIQQARLSNRETSNNGAYLGGRSAISGDRLVTMDNLGTYVFTHK